MEQIGCAVLMHAMCRMDRALACDWLPDPVHTLCSPLMLLVRHHLSIASLLCLALWLCAARPYVSVYRCLNFARHFNLASTSICLQCIDSNCTT